MVITFQSSCRQSYKLKCYTIITHNFDHPFSHRSHNQSGLGGRSLAQISAFAFDIGGMGAGAGILISPIAARGVEHCEW